MTRRLHRPRAVGRRIRSSCTVNRPVTLAPNSAGAQGRSRHASMAGHQARVVFTCPARRALTRLAATTPTVLAFPGSTADRAVRHAATPASRSR